MDTLQGSCNSFATIVTEILDITKIETGLLNIADIDFELTSEVDTAIQTFTKVALAQDLRLNYIGPDSCAASFVVRGNPTRLRQLIVNLVENAIKFTKAGDRDRGS
ncbi:hypothetical protein DPSP01_014556 [Paraphaeosphaeria sporulosa]